MDVELAAAISTISGFTVRRILQDWSESSSDARSRAGLINLFQTLAPANDPLIGRWTLGEWNYQLLRGESGSEEELPTSWVVISGGLSIWFKYPQEQRWKGHMSLKYRHTGEIKSRLPSILKTPFGGEFRAAYEVEFAGDPDGGSLSGTSRIVWREPETDVEHTGEFQNLVVSSTALTGTFRNHSKRATEAIPIADPVTFIQHRPWSEVLASFSGEA